MDPHSVVAVVAIAADESGLEGRAVGMEAEQVLAAEPVRGVIWPE